MDKLLEKNFAKIKESYDFVISLGDNEKNCREILEKFLKNLKNILNLEKF